MNEFCHTPLRRLCSLGALSSACLRPLGVWRLPDAFNTRMHSATRAGALAPFWCLLGGVVATGG